MFRFLNWIDGQMGLVLSVFVIFVSVAIIAALMTRPMAAAAKPDSCELVGFMQVVE